MAHHSSLRLVTLFTTLWGRTMRIELKWTRELTPVQTSRFLQTEKNFHTYTTSPSAPLSMRESEKTCALFIRLCLCNYQRKYFYMNYNSFARASCTAELQTNYFSQTFHSKFSNKKVEKQSILQILKNKGQYCAAQFANPFLCNSVEIWREYVVKRGIDLFTPGTKITKCVINMT